MKRLICALMCVIMLCSLFACKKEESGRSEYSLLGGVEKSDTVPQYDFMSAGDIQPEGYDSYTKGTTNFAFALLSQSVQQDENVVMSPFSVSSTLSLLANGGSNKTLKELRTTLAGAEPETSNTSLHYLSSRLAAFSGEEGKFISADSLWLNDSFDVKNTFLQTAVNYYNAEVMRLDLSQSTAKDKVNTWISDYTDGKIEGVVDEVDEDAVALIVSAVLMEDVWAIPYNDAQITEGTFHGSKTDTTASFMNSTESYISTTYAQGFVKGFENLPLRFAALVPAEDVSMEEFVDGLTATRWQSLLSSQQATSFCAASMPQFEAEYKSDLCEALKALGIEQAFDADKADFSQMSNTGTPYVSKVIHDAFIKIGPQGAKAGAATVVESVDTGVSDTNTELPEVVLDRPFVFVIYDNESGIPVFTGVINNIAE